MLPLGGFSGFHGIFSKLLNLGVEYAAKARGLFGTIEFRNDFPDEYVVCLDLTGELQKVRKRKRYRNLVAVEGSYFATTHGLVAYHINF